MEVKVQMGIILSRRKKINITIVLRYCEAYTKWHEDALFQTTRVNVPVNPRFIANTFSINCLLIRCNHDYDAFNEAFINLKNESKITVFSIEDFINA